MEQNPSLHYLHEAMQGLGRAAGQSESTPGVCADKDDATLLREGFAELRRAFPDMPEFKMHVVQEWSGVVN